MLGRWGGIEARSWAPGDRNSTSSFRARARQVVGAVIYVVPRRSTVAFEGVSASACRALDGLCRRAVVGVHTVRPSLARRIPLVTSKPPVLPLGSYL